MKTSFRPTLNAFEDRLNLSPVLPTDRFAVPTSRPEPAVTIEYLVLGAVPTPGSERVSNLTDSTESGSLADSNDIWVDGKIITAEGANRNDFLWSPIGRPAADPNRARLDSVVILNASLPFEFHPLPSPLRLSDVRPALTESGSNVVLKGQKILQNAPFDGNAYKPVLIVKEWDANTPQSPADANETITLHGTRTEFPAGHTKFPNLVFKQGFDTLHDTNSELPAVQKIRAAAE